MTEKLLIVEDEDTLRESLKRVLQHEGYTVDSVDSCESAFDSLECKSYDLIISDIILRASTVSIFYGDARGCILISS